MAEEGLHEEGHHPDAASNTANKRIISGPRAYAADAPDLKTKSTSVAATVLSKQAPDATRQTVTYAMAMAASNSTVTALREASRDGSLSAAFILGRLHEEGWGLRKDDRAAFRWYKKAADGGMTAAYYFVAFAYYAGQGVARNPRESFRWFQRSADAGDLDGLYMEAYFLLEGTGVRADPTRAVRLLRKAAHRGSSSAMEVLAVHHLRRRRFVTARMWAERSLRAGNAVAPVWIQQIEREQSKAAAR